MKNRSWICYSLDYLGAIALLGAGFTLIGALWFAAFVPEPLLLVAFKYCLIGAASAFIMARLYEITDVMRSSGSARADDLLAPDTQNVEHLPQPERFSRAA